MTNLHLEYFDGYIYAGVTPMYVQPPPVAPHTVHDHPSAPKTHDHPLPMNGAFERRHDYGYYDDDEDLYDDFYDYGRHYDDEDYEDEDHGVQCNGHDFFFI